MYEFIFIVLFVNLQIRNLHRRKMKNRKEKIKKRKNLRKSICGKVNLLNVVKKILQNKNRKITLHSVKPKKRGN